MILNFLTALHIYSNYRTLYSWAKGKTGFTDIARGHSAEIQFPFNFDITGFERRLESALFWGANLFSEEEVIDIIYSSYGNSS